MRRLLVPVAAAALALTGCTGGTASVDPDDRSGQAPSTAATSEDFRVTEHGEFDEGWAMTFLPGSEHLLISQRGGELLLRDQASGDVVEVAGVPPVDDGGQGGLHDVAPGATYADDGSVYLSWVRDHPEGAQGVVGRGTLDADRAELTDLEVIWEQDPAAGNGHFALRLLVRDDHLFVTSGDRQEQTPAQDTSSNLGGVVRLTPDGDPAPGNPWAGDDGAAAELWTIGHRNPLGIAEDSQGRIWVSEMGPRHGDELNLLSEGGNYGWPAASMGRHYDGRDIPEHRDGDGFVPPAAYWVPAISPGSLLIYGGDRFDGWSGSALVGGLSGQSLVRVELRDETATVVQEWDMGERVRALAEAPDGAIWVLEDGPGGRLLELTPV